MARWLGMVLACGIALAALDAGATLDLRPPKALIGEGPRGCVPADQCCKVCDAGRACGNTCISAAKNCHKGRGCACNLEEVCGD
jgi:hypothetical protein